jgi:pimeloyl-ACP methyl ester carboxylesterase
MALKFPESVKKVVVSNSYASPSAYIEQCVTQNLSKESPGQLSKDGIVVYLLKQNLSVGFDERFPEIYRAIKENYLKTFSRIGVINQILATQIFNIEDRLCSIGSNTLIIYGDSDRVIPAQCSISMHEKIPNSRLIKVKDGSHSMNWEQSENFNRIVIEFLKSE